jgi:hypothetical protein
MDPVISRPSKAQTKYVYNEPDSSRNQDRCIYNQLLLSKGGGEVVTLGPWRG